MSRRLIASACLAAWLLSGCAAPFADEREAWGFDPYPSALAR